MRMMLTHPILSFSIKTSCEMPEHTHIVQMEIYAKSRVLLEEKKH